MTDPTPTPTRPVLPSLSLDYATGAFTNTLTGETSQAIDAVVLAYRDDRVLYPTIGEDWKNPLCVNGSTYGSAPSGCPCGFAEFGPKGEAPECATELTLLLWQDEGAQVVTLTARRSQVKTIERFLEMKSLLTGVLHDQRVSIRMTPERGLHRLTLQPGEHLDEDTSRRLGETAQRVQHTGAFGGL